MTITRRWLLSWIGALTLWGCSFPSAHPVYGDTQDRVADIMAWERLLLTPDEIRQMILQYNSFDNQIGIDQWNTGNYPRFFDMVASRIESGNIEQLPEIIREIAKYEIDSAYRNNPQAGFRPYDTSKLDNPNTFFGDIGENPNIAMMDGTLFDTRIKGRINFNSPDEMLRNLWLPEGLQDATFIVQDQNGVLIFASYIWGKLRFIAPTSPGTSALGTTPGDGLVYNDYTNLSHYYLNDEMKWLDPESLQAHIREGGRVGWSMPYARRILHNGLVDGYYTHIGEVNGQPASHGCIRLPAFWAYIMFYAGKANSPIYFRPDYKLPPESK